MKMFIKFISINIMLILISSCSFWKNDDWNEKWNIEVDNNSVNIVNNEKVVDTETWKTNINEKDIDEKDIDILSEEVENEINNEKKINIDLESWKVKIVETNEIETSEIEIDEDENVNNNWEEALVDETIKEIDDLFKILETTDDK